MSVTSPGNDRYPLQSVGRARQAVTEAIVAFTTGFRLEQAPAEAVANARLAILDCLGVSVLANRFPPGKALGRFMAEHAAPGSCTVWGTTLATSPRDAALANGTLAHALDFDDRNHSSTYSLAVPFAIAEHHGLSGRALLEAFIVAREVRNSLDALFAHRGSGIGPGSKGWHSNGILGPVAAACAAARIMGLGADITRMAIGLAAGSAGALTRDGGTMAKPFRTGHAGATGLTCALLADSGFTADDTAIEGERGLLDALGPLEPEVVAPLAKGLGKEFHLAKSIRGKQFASCSASHPGIEAMLRLRERHVLTPAHVARITCDLKPFPLLRERPRSGVEARFSLPFCLALALVKGNIEPTDFCDANVADPMIVDLMSRVSHRDGDRLTVATPKGEVMSETLARAQDLVTWNEIATKFAQSAGAVLTSEGVGRICEQVRTLESLPDVRTLGAWLRAA
jgi:2-methylcitrate dehydratase PrpD